MLLPLGLHLSATDLTILLLIIMVCVGATWLPVSPRSRDVIAFRWLVCGYTVVHHCWVTWGDTQFITDRAQTTGMIIPAGPVTPLRLLQVHESFHGSCVTFKACPSVGKQLKNCIVETSCTAHLRLHQRISLAIVPLTLTCGGGV